METKIYVGNLSYEITEDEVRALFSDSGTVVSVNLIMDRDSGRSKGFAFIEMSNQVEAEQAVKDLNGRRVANRELKVNLARPQGEKRRGYSSGYNRYGKGGSKRR